MYVFVRAIVKRMAPSLASRFGYSIGCTEPNPSRATGH
jgi:hypothetical protein